MKRILGSVLYYTIGTVFVGAAIAAFAALVMYLADFLNAVDHILVKVATW